MACALTPAGTPDGFVEVCLTGVVTQGEFDELSDRLAQHMHEWSRVLFDAASLENPTEVLTMVVRATCRVVLLAHVRQALVVGDNAAAAARTWVRLSSPGSAGVQAFTSRDVAVEWLVAAYQSTTGGS